MECTKCKVEMVEGKAFTIPDFPGMDVNSRGQTVSMDGPAIIVKVMKCPTCGYSIRAYRYKEV